MQSNNFSTNKEVAPARGSRKSLNYKENNNSISFGTAIKEAELQMYKKNYTKALEIFASTINSIETDTGELIMCRDDSVYEYHSFRNPLEEVLYREMAKPQRILRPTTESFDRLYLDYGFLLVELKRLDEAIIALNKAIRINPIDAEAILELAEINKLNSDWPKYLDLTTHCLSLVYTRRHMGRCYRNVGYYFIEQQKYNEAMAFYYISMIYDQQSKMAQSELMYIQQITGKPTPVPSSDDVALIFERNGIRFGANPLVLNIAARLGKSAEQQGDHEAARFFFSILKDLT